MSVYKCSTNQSIVRNYSSTNDTINIEVKTEPSLDQINAKLAGSETEVPETEAPASSNSKKSKADPLETHPFKGVHAVPM